VDSPASADLVVLDWSVDATDWRRDFIGAPCRTDVFLNAIAPRHLRMVRHHACHAAASFFTSTFERAAVLVVDGHGGGQDTQSLWIGHGSSLRLVAHTGVSGIGWLYEAATRRIGFGALETGKTMGLAPFGRHAGDFAATFTGHFSGIATDYGALRGADGELLALAGRALDDAGQVAAAYAVQQECERAMLHLAQWARRETGEANLCLGGEVALNGVANHRLLRAGIFERLFINPACSDTGLALGAALWGLHVELGVERQYEEVSPYTGPDYADEAYADAVKMAVADGMAVAHAGQAEERAVALLAAGRSVALFQGRSEMGPRALGHRSILMSPFTAAAREHLNHVVKRREPFRPFAPVVRLEDAEEYFDLGVASPFMLYVCPVRERWRERLAGVTHVDGSARPQTLAAGQNPRLRRLLTQFGQRTGVPVLLNSSFNVAGEPLVESPADAVRCFRAAALDALQLGDILLEKRRS
jgi:carbamoyltransferase